MAEMIAKKSLFEGGRYLTVAYDIRRKLGTPPLDQMVHPRMFDRPSQLPADPKSFLHQLCQDLPQDVQENAADLLHSLLQVDFTKRISARDALAHPYFEKTTKPMNKNQMCVPDKNSSSTESVVNELVDGSASVVLLPSGPARKQFGMKRTIAATEMKCTSQSDAELHMEYLVDQVRRSPLKPTEYLSDVHINFVMEMLNYHSCYLKKNEHAFCFNTAFLGRHDPRPFHDYKILHPTQPKAGALTARFRLFPLNVRNNHWILAIHDQHSDVLYALDSLCLKKDDEIQALARLLGVRQPVVALLNTPLQSDEYNCGCWVISFAIAVVNALSWTPSPDDPTLFTKLNVDGARDRLFNLARDHNWKKPMIEH